MTESLFTHRGVPLVRNALAKMKAKALRRGVWFRALTRAERAQMELTMRIVKGIRSQFLAKVVANIVEKLLGAMESRIVRLMREVGQPLARNLSLVARKWGNNSAESWAHDDGFVKYLTIMRLNERL